MTMAETNSLQELSNALKRDISLSSVADGTGSTLLLIGAGCSVSANIPLAKDIAQDLVRKLATAYSLSRGHSDSADECLRRLVDAGYLARASVYVENHHGELSVNWSSVYDRIFSDHYNSPKEVRRIFSDIFDKNGKAINWTHICIGELVRVGYVSTILTTNFDQLALEGIARTGRLPIVADGLEYLGRVTGESSQPQLIQIHGSRHTYHLRNSVEDTEELSQNHPARHAIDELFRTTRVFVAVGYGGREKGIMELLIEAGKRYPDTRIFWCTYSERSDELPLLVREFLATSKHSSVIYGYDSDQLFDELLGHLDIKTPKVIEDPLYVLRELTDNIAISDDSAISQKIAELKVKTHQLRTAEAHVEALSRSQKLEAMGQLASSIARDFNNVLTAVLLSIDHLLIGVELEGPVWNELLEVKRNANRAAVFVRQLVALSATQVLRPVVLNANDVIADLKMLIDRLVSGTAVKIVVIHAKDLWRVKIDLAQFEQVLINLAVNARDAMPLGGEIRIKASNVSSDEVRARKIPDVLVADFVEVEVSDQGIGIQPELMEKIFDPFFTTRKGSSGLGLSMIYGIIRQSGGHIFVDSTLGSGATFRILLPRTLEEMPEITPQSSDTQSIRLTGTRTSEASGTILVVEDEAPVSRAIKRTLETRGYVVLEANSGSQALDMMALYEEAGQHFDLVISNFTMPNMSGVELFNGIRATHSQIPFLFISDLPSENIAANLPTNAAFGILSKPFSLKQLASGVGELLGTDAGSSQP